MMRSRRGLGCAPAHRDLGDGEITVDVRAGNEPLRSLKFHHITEKAPNRDKRRAGFEHSVLYIRLLACA